MMRLVQLLLPALIPAWNFFDVIAPSPRIRYVLLERPDAPADNWCEFRPRPVRLAFPRMLGRLFWNPVWNETLFVMSCAERLLEYPTAHSEDEIFKRIAADVWQERGEAIAGDYLQFRLILVRRDGTALREELAYESPRRPLAGIQKG